MSRSIHITLVCDYCGSEEDVEEHVIAVDKKAPESVDSCPSCWQSRADVLAAVTAPGRSKKIADRQLARAKSAFGNGVRRPRTATAPATVKKTTAKTAAKKTSAKKTAAAGPATKPATRRSSTAKKTSAKKTSAGAAASQ